MWSSICLLALTSLSPRSTLAWNVARPRSGQCDSNADCLKRGLPPLPPKRQYKNQRREPLVPDVQFNCDPTLTSAVEYVPPLDGYYSISVQGAQGGDVDDNDGGFGAIMNATSYLTVDQIYNVVVGCQGGYAPGTTVPRPGAGGGGASAFYIFDTPMVVAGGGGGASVGTQGCQANAYDTKGTRSLLSDYTGGGGEDGGGGAGGFSDDDVMGYTGNGGGGEGQSSSGSDGYGGLGSGSGEGGGQAYRYYGGQGGAYPGQQPAGSGGFGGGAGGGAFGAGGGGGGYSGGGGGAGSPFGQGTPGGGGGSYYNTDLDVNLNNNEASRTGSGVVYISFVGGV